MWLSAWGSEILPDMFKTAGCDLYVCCLLGLKRDCKTLTVMSSIAMSPNQDPLKSNPALKIPNMNLGHSY